MVALHPSFMEQELERAELTGVHGRWDRDRIRFWADRVRAAYAAQPNLAGVGRPGMVSVETSEHTGSLRGVVRETPGRPADPSLFDDERSAA